jgi:TPR repeat protein
MKLRVLAVLGVAALTVAACAHRTPTTPPQPAGTALPSPASTGPLRGWVDLHAHPMSYLGFGGKAISGGVDVGLLLPADANCHHRILSPVTPDQVLGNDVAIHGGWSLTHLCGDVLRNTLVPRWEAAQGYPSVAEPKPGEAAGAPSYAFWPATADMLHQKMWIDWIQRAWAYGQRVMVALADHDDTTAHAFSGPGDGPNDDKGSANLQTYWLKALVARHDFMEIALNAAQLHDIVQRNHLAIVLGVEIDSIGNFDSDPEVMACEDLEDHCAIRAKSKVAAEIQRLYDDGIRYLFPIHVVDNVFGGTAAYTGIFNLANEFTYGSPWDLECAAANEGIVYDGGFGMSPGNELILKLFVLAKMFRGFDIPDPPTCPPGKVGVHNKRGLAKLGEFAIHEMMRQTGCTCAPPPVASAAAIPAAPVDVTAARSRCDGGDARACHTVGAAHEFGDGATEDIAEARKFYSRACDLKRAESCVYLGRMFNDGAGAPVDDKEAAKLFQRACDLHEPEGCHRLAGLHVDGSGVPKDPKKAADLERRACDAGFRHACMALAGMYKQGQAGTKDGAAAAKVHAQMCARGDSYGCRQTHGANR